MIVIDIQYQQFSEVNHLNDNFIPGVNKLKLTIDAISATKVYQKAYPIIAKQFDMLFPNLKKHICCSEKLSKGFRSIINNYDKNITDTIHLIEHIIIDIQCSLSKMKICSGITCNYYEPSNRYDIFVECIEERIGFLATQFVIDIVQRILNNNRFIVNPQLSELPLHNIIKPISIEYNFPTFVAKSVIENLHQIKN